ncbi:hypothetical protein KAW65_07130 [candidate division WOR-3 bacterium]|nr:hypothetical protein [candidate division WOR-3 bacterium]
MGQSVKVAISLPSDILSDIDKIAKQKAKSRSAIIKNALVHILTEEVDKETEIKAKALYEEINKKDRVLAEKFQPIIKETFATL